MSQEQQFPAGSRKDSAFIRERTRELYSSPHVTDIRHGTGPSFEEVFHLHIRLVYAVAKKYLHHAETVGLTSDDLIQEGMLGLLRAIQKFDPARGEFSTYAGQWIASKMERTLAVHSGPLGLYISPHYSKRIRFIEYVRERARKELGRTPSDEELFIATQTVAEERRIRPLSQAHVRAAIDISALSAVSLDAVPRDGGEFFHDRIAGQAPTAEQFVMAKQELYHLNTLRSSVLKMLDAESARDATIAESRLGLTDGKVMSLEALGKQYSLSRERVRQIQTRITERLNKALERQNITVADLVKRREELTEILNAYNAY